LQLTPPGTPGLSLNVQRCEEGQLMREFGFVAKPRAGD
jgi:hypothetical protein